MQPAAVLKVTTKRTMSYLTNFLFAFSHVFTALIGANHLIKFSAQCGAWREQKKLRGKTIAPVIDFVALHVFSDHDHCRRSWEKEKLVSTFRTQHNLW